ncbi:MAG: RagB/SusD family nutrient uptake outer membrane protein [Dysgonamonadaceae bacterium]|jgi:hypothetical protein|nr:RagB/SusD family nutrient uptake outer membrane protein [Dysgonamonadaceae bacterium]
MKLTNPFLILSMLCFAGTSCGDFLERSAQDLKIPVTTRDYKEILQGEAYFKDVSNTGNFINYMTDDVEFFSAVNLAEDANRKDWSEQASYLTSSYFATYDRCYFWDQEIETEFTDEFFKQLYHQILIANLCLDAVDDTDGTDDEKEILRGQAAFHRALAYFYLANTYAKPFNEAQSSDLCVPIKNETTTTTATFARNTVGEVWTLINNDIRTALDNLDGKDIASAYEVNHKAALIVASRIALFQEDYSQAILYGEEFLTKYGATNGLYDISMQDRANNPASNTTTNNSDAAVVNFFTRSNTEIVLSWGNFTYPVQAIDYNTAIGWRTSAPIDENALGSYLVAPNLTNSAEYEAKTLIGQYNFSITRGANGIIASVTGDRRPVYWFIAPRPYTGVTSVRSRYNYYVMKSDRSYDFSVCYNFPNVIRTGEVYLNLAEAYARRNSGGDAAKAIQYLNDLREKRIAPYAGTSEELASTTFASNSELVQFVWNERRRELCFEEFHRWWDLRRTGQPKIVHKWYEQTYTLQDHDPNYVLDFPIAEREYNGAKLVPNVRYAKTPD